MRKYTKFLVAGGALAALAVPSVASADVPRCQDTVATTTPTTHVESVRTAATFHATQPSGGGGNWNHTFDVTVNPDGTFSGTNEITGLDNGQMTTVNETVTGKFTDTNNDGVTEITLDSKRDSGFYTFEWGVTAAPMDGKVDSMTDGTVAYATAKDWTGGPLPITFTTPDWTVVEKTVTDDVPTTTTTTYKNHGEYVSVQGGGKAAAQSCVGMPLNSKQGK